MSKNCPMHHNPTQAVTACHELIYTFFYPWGPRLFLYKYTCTNSQQRRGKNTQRQPQIPQLKEPASLL